MQKLQAETYIGRCFTEGTLIALQEGEISYQEYLLMIEHCKNCEKCSFKMAETEQVIRQGRPEAPSYLALNSPKRWGCLSLEAIIEIKDNYQHKEPSSIDFFITHGCVCPRCYSVICQLNIFFGEFLEDDIFCVYIPFKILDEVMIKNIVGREYYGILKEDLRVKTLANGRKDIVINSICDFLFEERQIENNALILAFRKEEETGEHRLVDCDIVDYFEGQDFEEFFGF